jgi:endonuclease-3
MSVVDAMTPGAGLNERVAQIARRLDGAYGSRPWRRHAAPLEELIETVLSQHTSDANTARAYASLRARFPTWEAVRTADAGDVADAIRSGGLAQIKAPRIQRILDAIVERYGVLSLDALAQLPLGAARAELLRLDGVGPKTAACVLLFSLGLPAMPVDTHVHRVTTRLGLIPPGTTADRAHPFLEALIGADRDRSYGFHMGVIAHGRQVCHARRPRCERCVLSDLCDYVKQQQVPEEGA